VFGARHFSWRCVKASIFFSVAAFAIIAGLSVLSHPKNLFLIRWMFENDRAAFNVLVAYAIWSIVPDYFNLLKTRKVLGLITARKISRPSVLVLILLADFLIGFAIFTVSFWPMGLLSVHLWFYLLGVPGVDWHHVVSNFSFNPLPILSAFEWPFAISFWTGMVPSIWLWLYVAATLMVRLTASAAPVFRFSSYFLDIDQHPIRSVGVVAAALVGCLYIVIHAIWNVAELLSEAT
jgi:hypothetical protein